MDDTKRGCEVRGCAGVPPTRSDGRTEVLCSAHWARLPAEYQRRIYWGNPGGEAFVWERAIGEALRYLARLEAKERQTTIPGLGR
jgi:hypothetical protein